MASYANIPMNQSLGTNPLQAGQQVIPQPSPEMSAYAKFAASQQAPVTQAAQEKAVTSAALAKFMALQGNQQVR